MNEKILKSQALYGLIDYEPFVILLSLVIFAWLFYKLFLGKVSTERHKNLQNHFANITRHSLILSAGFIAFKFLYQTEDLNAGITRVLPYVSLFTLFWGMLVFVKTSRLILLQYMFLGSMKSGVPVLLVNIFSLLLSMTLLLWSASFLFGIQLGALLATSAAFSIILGLALQDTLGNLFAGISLQLDHSFEIGDWLEIVQGPQRIVGQVKEITWRATSLLGWSDELIILPNRTMANSQISNFQGGDQPIVRSQLFRLPLNTDVEKAKKALLLSLKDLDNVRQDLNPLAYIAEMTDSWLGVKIVYYIDSYGSQFLVGDSVLKSGINHLNRAGIELANQIYQIQQKSL